MNRIAIACMLLVGALSGCRALTEPGLEPDLPGSVRILEGQVFAPDGTPFSGGEIILDNRQYEPNEADWVQRVIALDDDGRFSVAVRIGERTDVIIKGAFWLDLPEYRILGLRTSQSPWSLRHAMVSVELPLQLPDSLLTRISQGQLQLTQRRPRPEGANFYYENYEIDIDSTATARGWVLSGLHKVTLHLQGNDGSHFHMALDDSLPVLGVNASPLAPRMEWFGLEVLMPELTLDVTADPRCEIRLIGHNPEPPFSWQGSSYLPFKPDQTRVWGAMPPRIEHYAIDEDGFRIIARGESEYFFVAEPLESIGPIRLGDVWLQVVLPPDVALPERYYLSLDSGGSGIGGRRVEQDGRVLFLLDRGSYLLDLHVDSSGGSRDELVHRQVVEVTESRTLYLDF